MQGTPVVPATHIIPSTTSVIASSEIAPFVDPLTAVQNAWAIPHDMRDMARYFLYRTTRNPRTMNEKEIVAMRELFEKHYPARVQKEIDTACERFLRTGRSLKMLRFGYIAASLRKHQVDFERRYEVRES